MNYKPEGGESLADVQIRIKEFISEITENHKGNETILLCTHGCWINMFLYEVIRMPDENIFIFKPKNSSVTEIEITNDKKYSVNLINCVKHLEN